MGGYYRRTIKHKYNYNEEEKSIFVYGKISDKSPYKERNRKERGSYTFILKVKFYN